MKGAAKTALVTMAISSVAVGTPVLAFNEQAKQQEVQPVTATITHGKNDQSVVTLKLESSDGKQEVLETTPEHPFAIRVGQDGQIAWVNAIDLTKGQSIARADGRSGRLISRSVEARDTQLYNLSVARAHTYYVGEQQWLVHNSDCSVIAKSIASNTGRHDSFVKHVLVQGDLAGLELRTREQLAEFVDQILSSPNSYVRSLSGGRTAYWDPLHDVVVILNPNSAHQGTIFRPSEGISYFFGLR